MRPRDLSGIVLTKGQHSTRAHGLDVLEAVALYAGLMHSDHPSVVCPVLAAAYRRLNDSGWSSDAARTAALLPVVPRLVGTKADADTEDLRGRALVSIALRLWLPLVVCATVAALEAIGRNARPLRAAGVALCERPDVASAEALRAALALMHPLHMLPFNDPTHALNHAVTNVVIAAGLQGSLWSRRGAAVSLAVADNAATAAADASHAMNPFAGNALHDARRDDVLAWAAGHVAELLPPVGVWEAQGADVSADRQGAQ